MKNITKVNAAIEFKQEKGSSDKYEVIPDISFQVTFKDNHVEDLCDYNCTTHKTAILDILERIKKESGVSATKTLLKPYQYDILKKEYPGVLDFYAGITE